MEDCEIVKNILNGWKEGNITIHRKDGKKVDFPLSRSDCPKGCRKEMEISCEAGELFLKCFLCGRVQKEIRKGDKKLSVSKAFKI